MFGSFSSTVWFKIQIWGDLETLIPELPYYLGLREGEWAANTDSDLWRTCLRLSFLQCTQWLLFPSLSLPRPSNKPTRATTNHIRTPKLAPALLNSSLLREGKVQNHQDPAWRLTQREEKNPNKQGTEENAFSSLHSLVFNPDLF